VFYFRLALALGFPHPDYMLAILSSAQITDWIEYYRVEPWGEPVNWQRHGESMAMQANIHRGKNARVFRPGDFMPPEPGAKTSGGTQSINEQRSVLEGIFGPGKCAVEGDNP